MKKGTTRIFGAALALAILASACKQDAVQDMTPTSKSLHIALNESYMPAAKIDSAIAIWEINGTTQTIRLQPADNQLITSLIHFKNAGTGTLTVQLFTQTKTGDQPLQWEKRFTYTLDKTKPLSLIAPSGIKDTSWSPRIMTKVESYPAHVTAIIALRPEDSYFELKDVSPAVAKRIEIVRSFYLNDTTTAVASRGWIGDASKLDAKGNLVDREHFQNLMELLDGKQWNRFKIRASFYAALNPHQIYEFEMENEKP